MGRRFFPQYRGPVLLPLLAALGAGLRGEPTPSGGPTRSSISAVATPEVLASFLPLRAAVGSWAEYAVRSSGEQEFRVRFSVVPPAMDDGRAWVEVTALGEVSLPVAARLLVRDRGGVERALVYVLGQAPLELPVDAPEGAPQPGRREPRRARSLAVGSADVNVPAGRFRTEEMRIVGRGPTVRAWRSDRVPLWGLVCAEGPRQLVELVAYGQSGARSVFPEAHGKGSDTAK
jgi:hypothetical protein